MKSKIKPKSPSISKEDVMKEVDNKFKVFYGQVESFATEQADFNNQIFNEHISLKEPILAQIEKMKNESNQIMRELNRTQKQNRKMIHSSMIMQTSPNTVKRLENHRFDRHQRNANRSVNHRTIAQSDEFRYLTPARNLKNSMNSTHSNFVNINTSSSDK